MVIAGDGDQHIQRLAECDAHDTVAAAVSKTSLFLCARRLTTLERIRNRFYYYCCRPGPRFRRRHSRNSTVHVPAFIGSSRRAQHSERAYIARLYI